MKDLFDFIANTSDFGLVAIIAGILLVLYVLPNTVRKLGISRLGPLEMEHRHQSQNYETTRQINDIDLDNRESLWDMTEDLFDAVAESSPIHCDAAVGFILSGVASPIRTMVLLNHIAPKLVRDNEDALVAKIRRGIARSVKDARRTCHGDGCPVAADVSAIDTGKYDVVISDWLMRARSITSKACRDKIAVYNTALSMTNDKFWRRVYAECIDRNKGYIRGMGYEV